jgi:PAS domain S-box-containing protein
MNKTEPTSPYRSIRKRLTIVLAIVVSAILLIFSTIAIVYNSKYLEHRLQSKLNNLSNLAATGLSSALWQYNNEYVNDYVESLFSDEDLILASVDTDGKTIARRVREGIDSQAGERLLTSNQVILKDEDIHYNDIIVGHIRLALSRSRIENLIIKNSVLAIFLLSLILISIFLTVFFLSKKYIFEPLEQLEDFAHSISEGHLDARIDITSQDEMGRLSHAFNQMVVKLKDTMATRDELEDEIAERKRVEEALRDSEQLLNEMGRIGGIGGWEHDLVTRKATWTEEIYHIIGIESGRIPGPDEHLDYYPPEDREKLETAYRRAMETGEEFDLELQCVTSQGRTLWARAKGRPEFKDGVCVKMRGIFQDITERKQDEFEREQLQSQLIQARKMEAIGTLAGGIAHDFNNILAAILGYAELAHASIPEASEAKPHLEQVLKSGVRAKNLVQQILSFSRPSAREKKPIRIGPVIEETIKLLRATLPTTIEILYESDSSTHTVPADPTQIQQLLINLFTNAAHAMREQGGIIHIRIETLTLDELFVAAHAELDPGVYIRVTIDDTGEGMDKQTLDRIFEPFFTTKEVGQGTGMGLAITHGIVSAHGGCIEVESEPGKGSSFRVYLPVAGTETEEQLPGELPPPPSGSEHVLLVDDEPLLADVGKQMLERLGYKVTSGTSSLQALEIFKSRPADFDLVLTDQTMPKMTGLDLAGALLEIRPDIPIIIYTGFSTDISDEEIASVGVKRVLMKPLAIREVAAAIREVLDQQ